MLKKAIITTITLLVFCSIFMLLPTKEEKSIKQQEEIIEQEQSIMAEIDLQAELSKLRTINVQRMIKSLNNEVEFILLTEEGEHTLFHDKDSSQGAVSKFFSESTITLTTKYRAIFSIAIKDIQFKNNSGELDIQYNRNDIKIKAVEVLDTIPLYNKSVFGKKYTNEELLALSRNAKEDIYNQLENDQMLKNICEGTLNELLGVYAEEYQVPIMKVNQLSVKTSYSLLKPPTIAFNHPNEYLDRVDYIVVHSTAVKGLTAQDFYTRLNTNPSLKVSAHFFVDDTQVIQMLPTNQVAWAVGRSNGKTNCTNYNSISVEICEVENQQKAIDNTVDLVYNVLKVKYPNAKVIKHRDVSATECPQIMNDEEFSRMFN